ncbi:hypothetical protein QA640_37460 [Bradyrhizobium sp. CB82]|uniref:hypothetical protein n=1 Tax=Bradyrhizobium sp. CB82 TaxID=3039159 RepID=UPI0024B2696E|nr:hypothetical protein [Bradyrhizobium sp. CB82]WFU39932.1 hypothetical protein QA640_37460 [Bradyrhizobium sp. CB82]
MVVTSNGITHLLDRVTPSAPIRIRDLAQNPSQDERSDRHRGPSQRGDVVGKDTWHNLALQLSFRREMPRIFKISKRISVRRPFESTQLREAAKYIIDPIFIVSSSEDAHFGRFSAPSRKVYRNEIARHRRH